MSTVMGSGVAFTIVLNDADFAGIKIVNLNCRNSLRSSNKRDEKAILHFLLRLSSMYKHFALKFS